MQVGMALTPNSLARRKPGVQIPSPPPPTPQVRASPASSGETLTACSGRAAAASSCHSPARRALRDARELGPRPHHDHPAWSPSAANGRATLARIPPLPVGHPVDLAHCPTTAHDDDQVEADPPLAQHDLCQPRGPGSNLGQTTRRRGHGGRHADPGHPSRAAAGPTASPHDLIPVGHNGRRRPDTGHLDTQLVI